MSLPTPGEAANLIVLELFTSQPCSSCPLADALLAELSRTQTDILVLDSQFTHWDRLGWKDPYSLPEAIGSDRPAVLRLG